MRKFRKTALARKHLQNRHHVRPTDRSLSRCILVGIRPTPCTKWISTYSEEKCNVFMICWGLFWLAFGLKLQMKLFRMCRGLPLSLSSEKLKDDLFGCLMKNRWPRFSQLGDRRHEVQPCAYMSSILTLSNDLSIAYINYSKLHAYIHVENKCQRKYMTVDAEKQDLV